MKGDQRPAIAAQFGSNLARLRQRAGLAQEIVAQRSDLHRTEISLLERGARLPRIDTVIKLAAALNLSVEALLADISWKKPEAAPVNGEFLVGPPPGQGTSVEPH